MSDAIDDMSPFLSGKADHLTAADLLGGPRVVRVVRVRKSPEPERPVQIDIDGGLLPWRPCLTMRRLMAACWGAQTRVWVGRSIRLWTDPSVQWGGESVGGIRIEAMTDIPNRGMSVSLQEKRGKKRAYRVSLLTIGNPVDVELARLGITTDQVDAWLETKGKPALSSGTAKQAATLLDYIGKTDSVLVAIRETGDGHE